LFWPNYVSAEPILLISGSFAEEDIGRHGITVPSAVGNANASRGLEVAVANLQEYCNGQYFTKNTCTNNFPLKMKKYSPHEFFMFIQSN
jgi:hypothetical protein